MHLLITRPQADARVLGKSLEDLGHRVSYAPLIDIEFLPVPAQVIQQADALIATSRNGLRALAVSDVLKTALSLPLFVVGPGTAKLARDLGFATITEGAGTAAALAAHILMLDNAPHHRFVHLAGADLAFDLAGVLRAGGADIRKYTVYQAITATRLPEDIQADIGRGGIDAVVLMSPRTAAAWHQILLRFDAQSPVRRGAQALDHICLSAAVADTLQMPDVKRVHVALEPNSAQLLGLIQRLAASSP